jgi:cellobiose-specific phosphotransferase system component IIC
MQELWDAIKISNLWSVGIEKEEVIATVTSNIFNKIIEENSSTLEAFRTPNR